MLRILRAPITDPTAISPELAASCDSRYTMLRKRIGRFISLTDELKLTLKLMVLGVAFEVPGDHKVRVVYSHEGEEIGTAPTHHVETLVHRLCGIGITATKIGGQKYMPRPGGKTVILQPGVTYGH